MYLGVSEVVIDVSNGRDVLVEAGSHLARQGFLRQVRSEVRTGANQDSGAWLMAPLPTHRANDRRIARSGDMTEDGVPNLRSKH